MDLYLYGDENVRFDYQDGRLEVIYEVDGRSVHFEYDDEAVVWTVTLLAQRVDRH